MGPPIWDLQYHQQWQKKNLQVFAGSPQPQSIIFHKFFRFAILLPYIYPYGYFFFQSVQFFSVAFTTYIQYSCWRQHGVAILLWSKETLASATSKRCAHIAHNKLDTYHRSEAYIDKDYADAYAYRLKITNRVKCWMGNTYIFYACTYIKDPWS